MWRAYLDLIMLGYERQTVNHSLNFKDENTGTHTNIIEGTWNGIKMNIKPRNRTVNIGSHLGEFIWRSAYKNNLWNVFLEALSVLTVNF